MLKDFAASVGQLIVLGANREERNKFLGVMYREYIPSFPANHQ